MYNTVRKFFALHHHLALPGIGNFSVENAPAQIDYTDRTVSSCRHKIIFSNEKLPAEKKFYNFLSHEMGIDEIRAVCGFTDFTSQLHDKLNAGENVCFKGIGTLTQQTSNVVVFEAEEIPLYFPSITAERTVRKNATHTVRVGEDEKTSDEMQAALHQPKKIKEERWWIAAVVLAVIGVAAIAFYYATQK